MRARRLLILAAAGLPMAIILAGAAAWYWERKKPVFQEAPKLIAALQAFCRDHAAQGRQLPPEVPLADLVAGRYLTTHDVAPFEGMVVVFFTQADPSMPGMFLARARTPGGDFVCLPGDGSVLGYSAARYKEAFENSGQAGSADGSQPSGSETNRESGAAGFRP